MVWRAVFFTGALVGLMTIASASQLVLSANFLGQPLPWMNALKTACWDNYPWLILIPLIIWFCRALPLMTPHGWWRLPFYGLAALIAAGLYTLIHSKSRDQIYFVQVPPPMLEPPIGAPGPAVRLLTEKDRFEAAFLNGAVFHMMTFGVVVICWHAWEVQRRSREREKHAAQLARQLTEARLQSLRLQLQPHFLFNTLNTIASLIHDQPDQAEDMLIQLSELLRYSLRQTTEPLIPLHHEFQLLDRYLAIEQVRFGDRLSIHRNLDQRTLSVLVPSFLLQPLVENAIRHGLEPMPRLGRLNLESFLDQGQLVLRVIDNGNGFNELVKNQQGIGLRNTQARLTEHYGAQFTFKLHSKPGTGTQIEIRLPCQSISLLPQ